jgi:hypothetical protein
MKIVIIYLISFFLAVCCGMITTATGNGGVAVIYVSVIAIWILTANIMIAVKLKKFQAMVL